jgi:hypothetical protein
MPKVQWFLSTWMSNLFRPVFKYWAAEERFPSDIPGLATVHPQIADLSIYALHTQEGNMASTPHAVLVNAVMDSGHPTALLHEFSTIATISNPATRQKKTGFHVGW